MALPAQLEQLALLAHKVLSELPVRKALPEQMD
jgi:hypothetical protein